MRVGSEVYHTLKKVIVAKYGLDSSLIGDEGGYAPPVKSADDSSLDSDARQMVSR